MERVEGFNKNNVGVVTETFRFDALNDFKLESAGGNNIKITVGDSTSTKKLINIVGVSFDERDRKAVADLFRKMADSLDPEISNLVKSGRVTKSDVAKMFGVPELKDPTHVHAFKGPISMVDLLLNTGLCDSPGNAKRTVAEGGAYLNREKITDPEFLPSSGLHTIGKGKRASAVVDIV